MFLLTLSFLLSTLKQRAAASKLKSTRNRHSLNSQEIVNRRLAAKKHVEGMKKAGQMDGESSIASPSAGTKNSASKKRKGASSTSTRKSARISKFSETGQDGKKLGSLMEEAADSENNDDDDKEDGGSKKKRSGKK